MSSIDLKIDGRKVTINNVEYTVFRYTDYRNLDEYKYEFYVTNIRNAGRYVEIEDEITIDYVYGNIVNQITIPVKTIDCLKSYDLEDITIGNNVTYICEGAFKKCPNLTNITLPKSLNGIGEYAFADSLERIIVQNINMKDNVCEGAFNSKSLEYFILKGDEKEIYIDVYKKKYECLYYDLFTFNDDKIYDINNLIDDIVENCECKRNDYNVEFYNVYDIYKIKKFKKIIT